MFCSKCGLENQQAGVYCRQCGTMQPGPTAVAGPNASREIKKTRIASVTIGAFSLVSAVILIWTLLQPDARYEGRLAVAAAFSLLVAAYQAYTLYLGLNISEARSAPVRDDARPDDLIYSQPRPAIGQASFQTADLPISSVTEHTTRTLEPVERQRPK